MEILLAEDNPDDLFLMQQAFRKVQGAGRLHSVCDGLEAQAYLRGEAGFADRIAYPIPDILLLDLNMPRLNGFEVLQWLRQEALHASLTVHVLTASSRDEDVLKAYQLGANSYVVKPTRLDELVLFVKALHEWHRFTSIPKAHGGGRARFPQG